MTTQRALGLIFSMTGALAISACAKKSGSPEQHVDLQDVRSQSSYAIGFELGADLKAKVVELDPSIVCAGLEHGLGGQEPLLAEPERKSRVSELRINSQTRLAAERKQRAADNAKQGEAFRAEHKARPGVTTLPSGLQYRVLKNAHGPKPTIGDTAICHYRLTTTDGKELESSRKAGRPAELAVGKLIKGFTEALERMPVGSTWELVVPPDLAYGERGATGKVGSNATLVFEVELLSIKPRTAVAATQVTKLP